MGWTQDWRCDIRSRELEPSSSIYANSFPDEIRASECLAACVKTGMECCRVNYDWSPAKCHAGVIDTTQTAGGANHWGYSLESK